MRVIVTGSRHWDCDDLAATVVARYGSDIVIVHGAAPGVDMAFDRAAKAAGLTPEPHPAPWDELDRPGAVIRHDRNGRPYNANAGPARNAEMVQAGADFVLAVHLDLGRSRGTLDCVRQALDACLPVWLIDSEDPDPRRIRVERSPR